MNDFITNPFLQENHKFRIRNGNAFCIGKSGQGTSIYPEEMASDSLTNEIHQTLNCTDESEDVEAPEKRIRPDPEEEIER